MFFLSVLLYPPCRIAIFSFLTCFSAQVAFAHEAWLLTPGEIEALARQPVPTLFSSRTALVIAALIGSVITITALFVERQFKPFEDRIASHLVAPVWSVAPLVLRLGLACMLVLAGLGGLPRHGTPLWAEPTFLVPDMQLALVPGWMILVVVQFLIAYLLIIGFLTRVCGAALVGLSGLGLALFGLPFLSYAPHFAAPGLLVVLFGAGRVSIDYWVGLDTNPFSQRAREILWRIAQALVGAGFLYLAVVYKLMQPTLLIAILQHGSMPSFGLGYPFLALIMTGVEIICGALLLFGRVVRPVSLAILGAITFLAITLGETPLFHVNLYALMLIFAMAGRDVPRVRAPSLVMRRALI